MADDLIYFDNAATTFPKPRGVIDISLDCMQNWCGNAGRGSHPLALKSAESIYSAREALSSLFSASPENVIFTSNTTHSLNLAIKGMMSRGGHVLISDMEHNSALRPIVKLARERHITYDIYPTHKNGLPLTTDEIISGIIRRMLSSTKMVCAIHTSNICSYSLPIREIGALCRRHGLIFSVDAAQGAGHSEISIENDLIDLLSLPSHKGLYAPQGAGALIIREGLMLDTVIEGGNGVGSLELSMGNISPERYEGGTLCTPAIAGIHAGIEFIQGIGISAIAEHERELWRCAYSRLSRIDGVRIYDHESVGGILLFNIEGYDPDEVGIILSEHGICTRTGYHCAPLAHKALGTPDGGAVRVSFSVFNNEREVEKLCDVIGGIARS